MSAEDVVLDTMMQTVSKTTAKFLLDKLKEEWLAKGSEKTECDHANWRNVYDETDIWRRCDLCEAVNFF